MDGMIFAKSASRKSAVRPSVDATPTPSANCDGYPRLAGAHCYEVYGAEHEPGTFFLTDFLVRSFAEQAKDENRDGDGHAAGWEAREQRRYEGDDQQTEAMAELTQMLWPRICHCNPSATEEYTCGLSEISRRENTRA